MPKKSIRTFLASREQNRKIKTAFYFAILVAAAGDWTRKGTLTVPFHTIPPSDTCERTDFSVSINPRPCHSEPVTDVTGVGIRNLLAGNLRKSTEIMRFGNGLSRQCAHWLAMTGFFDRLGSRLTETAPFTYYIFHQTTLIISKKPGNTGISRDIRTEFTTDLLLSD